jgi:hypothetical protein
MAQLPISELIIRLKSVKFTLEQEAQNIVAVAAMDLKGLSETNILNRGVAKYSPVKLPTFWYRDKTLNQRGTQWIKDNDWGSWGEFRKAQGLQVAYVDLFYSGHMWHNTGVVRIERVGSKFIAYLGGQDKKAADHLFYMSKLYGPFITANVSSEDKAFINNNAQQTYINILKQVGV